MSKAEPAKPPRKRDPYRWLMSPDMALQWGFLFLPFLVAGMAGLLFSVMDWPPSLQFAALALSLSILSLSLWTRRRAQAKSTPGQTG